MPDQPGTPHQTDAWYRLRVRGHLSSHWSDWFDNMTITQDADGNTTIEGLVYDQAALYGVISKVRNLGLTLLMVQLIDHRA